MTTCARCLRPVSHPHRHHPDREGRPDHTVAMHPECHRRLHSERGDFRAGGRLTPTKGRRGYEHALKACEMFHHLGGRARAAGARRDLQGRFV